MIIDRFIDCKWQKLISMDESYEIIYSILVVIIDTHLLVITDNNVLCDVARNQIWYFYRWSWMRKHLFFILIFDNIFSRCIIKFGPLSTNLGICLCFVCFESPKQSLWYSLLEFSGWALFDTQYGGDNIF